MGAVCGGEEASFEPNENWFQKEGFITKVGFFLPARDNIVLVLVLSR